VANPERLNADGLALSEHYAETMEEVILPYINARRRDFHVSGDGGKPLFASRFDAEMPKGTVLIVHGFTENSYKFSEVVHSLLRNHLSVITYDQRGHGRSWRAEGLGDPSLTHVDDFQEYVRDLDSVVAQAMAAMPRPHRIFCHSMGGAVTALYLESVGDDVDFDRAAMCAPMIAPNLNKVPKPAARLLCRTAEALGRGKKRIFASRPYGGKERFEDSCATGVARFHWYENQRVNDPILQNNGPTYGWTLESIGVTMKILAPGAPERIRTRIQLSTAGLDGTVMPGPQKQFIDRVRDGEHIVVEGSKHEIYRSSDEVLFPWWHGVLAFLKG